MILASPVTSMDQRDEGSGGVDSLVLPLNMVDDGLFDV